MSSADKRSPHTDALETLGMVHFKQEKRDAIHIAVEPVVAGQLLHPNDDVYLFNGHAYTTAPIGKVNFVGKVDCFLTRPVKEGESFWLMLYPRQVTSLRHVWEHPAFDKETD